MPRVEVGEHSKGQWLPLDQTTYSPPVGIEPKNADLNLKPPLFDYSEHEFRTPFDQVFRPNRSFVSQLSGNFESRLHFPQQTAKSRILDNEQYLPNAQ